MKSLSISSLLCKASTAALRNSLTIVTGHDHHAVMVKSVAERKQEERERRKALGLKRYELWMHPNDWPKLRKLYDRLMRRFTK